MNATMTLPTWRASDFQMGVLAVNLINRKILIDAVPGIFPHTSFGSQLSNPKLVWGEIPGTRSPSLCYPFEWPKKSSSQIPLFVSITIARLLHHLRIYTPHTAYIGGNLTSRAHQFDPKRRMPPSNISRMTQNIVINARQDLVQTHLHYINLLRFTPYILPQRSDSSSTSRSRLMP